MVHFLKMVSIFATRLEASGRITDVLLLCTKFSQNQIIVMVGETGSGKTTQ